MTASSHTHTQSRKRKQGGLVTSEHRPFVVRYVRVPVVRCRLCNHEWPIKVDTQGKANWPVKCASCGSPLWDRVRNGEED